MFNPDSSDSDHMTPTGFVFVLDRFKYRPAPADIRRLEFRYRATFSDTDDSDSELYMARDPCYCRHTNQLIYDSPRSRTHKPRPGLKSQLSVVNHIQQP